MQDDDDRPQAGHPGAGGNDAAICPGCNELEPLGHPVCISAIFLCTRTSDACLHAAATCRGNLQRSSRGFQRIVSSPEFEAFRFLATAPERWVLELFGSGGRAESRAYGCRQDAQVCPDRRLLIVNGFTDVQPQGYRYAKVRLNLR